MNGMDRASENKSDHGIRASVHHVIEVRSQTDQPIELKPQTDQDQVSDDADEIYQCMHHTLLQLHSTGQPASQAYQPIPSS
jgi:hypothetical protein